MVNKDAPYAFNLNEDTLLLVHNNPEEARLKEDRQRILLHASSVYHFAMEDPPKHVSVPILHALNQSSPKSISHQKQLFTTRSLTLRSVHPFHSATQSLKTLGTFFSYLILYTTSDKGYTLVLPGYRERQRTRESEPEFDTDFSRVVELDTELIKDFTQRKLLPRCLGTLSKLRFDNRLYLFVTSFEITWRTEIWQWIDMRRGR
ncbi:hypothetical protein PQX77_005646 [Marasmius sp. AFHP31]|nr:hypothetical protein PQX77_005646 [Marasmius sp. AFHP31]